MKHHKKLSIIIPVYNEEKYIFDTIFGVVEAKTGSLQKEVVVVDDGSLDKTYKEIKQSIRFFRSKKIRFKTIKFKKNRGKGAAVRAALKKTSGQIILIQDADLEYSPSEYPSLLSPILAGDADVVYGSRFVGDRPHRVLYFWHMVANKLLTLLSNMLTNINLTDMETGYKVFTKKVAKRLTIRENRFGFEPEFTAKVAKNKFRIYEVGIGYRGRSYHEGKKIDWRDGLKALWYIFYYHFFSR